jgi:hypothetical protein
MDSHKNPTDKKDKKKTDAERSADAVETPTPPQQMNPLEKPASEETPEAGRKKVKKK